MQLSLFVYGTLKRGEANSASICAGALGHVAATTRGRLFALPAGYPALAPSADVVLAAASGDLVADLAAERLWTQRLARGRAATASADADPGTWSDVVHGEWVSFSDGVQRLARIDRFEGCRPGHLGLFDRQLIRIWTVDDAQARAAWAYVQPTPAGRWLRSGRWPA